MSNYNANDFVYNGSVDIEESTIIPQGRTAAGVLSNKYMEFDKDQVAAVQLFSDDIDGNILWSLEVSLDKTIWAAATDGAGDAVAGALVVDVPTVVLLEGVKGVYFRIKLTVTTETGTIAYKIKA